MKKSWAKLRKLNFAKHKPTTKSKLTIEELKQLFLMDIRAVVDFEAIPNQLIINWD